MASSYNPEMARVGERIVRRREELRVTATELAIQVDIPASTLSLYESGQRIMGIDKLLKISEALRVPLSYFNETPPSDNTDLSIKEREILEKLRKLPSEKRQLATRMILAQLDAI